jgi:1,4-alpha-glucan branching enzyme
MEKKRKIEGSERELVTLKQVDFTLSAPEAKTVLLTGDFNDWDTHSHPLKKDPKKTWRISLDLKPGRYEYRFLVDGVWQNDPNCETLTPNSFGSENSVLTLE